MMKSLTSEMTVNKRLGYSPFRVILQYVTNLEVLYATKAKEKKQSP